VWTKEAHGLRDLARQIRDVATKHDYYGQARDSVRTCVDHLCLLASYHEANKEIQHLKSYIEGAAKHD